MQNAAIYGLGEKASLNLVANSAKWVQETGADMNALMKLQGTASRYGLGDNVIQNAYGGLIASGMGRGQFNEFLQGLQSVIEDGISNGYITSTEDVTRNLTMYARLSDNNPLWQGQNGARMFTQMNNNLAQATSLSDTNSALVFSALHKGGSYVDTMEAIEKGLNDKDAFGKIFSTFMQSEGGNYEGVIERLRATYGLNYTQAKQVFAMGNKLGSAGYTQADFERDIKANGITPNAETEQTIWKDVENDLKNSMQLIGMGRWEQNLEELKNLAAEERGRGLETAKETGNINALTDAMKANGSANRGAREGLKESKTYGSMFKELEDKNSVYADVLYTELGAAAFSSKYGDKDPNMAGHSEYIDILSKMLNTGIMPGIAETNKDVLAAAFQKALEQAFGNGKVVLTTY